MTHSQRIKELCNSLADIPLLDAHTHLTGSRLSARGLHDILLYHMVVSDLYAAGCPSGHRLTEFPGYPDDDEARARIREALPYLPKIRNTSCHWGLRIILRDLFEWNEPVDAGNWQRLDDRIRERADDRAWQRKIMKRMNAHRFVTEWSRRLDGSDDDLLQYSLEWAFFTRTQRGQNDNPLYELERCWGLPTGTPVPHGLTRRPAPAREIRTVEDVHLAMDHYVNQLAAVPVLSNATHISTDIAFRSVSEGEMAVALARRDQAGTEERDIYASYLNEVFLSALAEKTPKVAFQFSFAAEPLPHETGSIVPQRAISDLADMMARHPKVTFICFLASRHANQSLCTLCRELPNLALAGYWWHNFFPGAIRQVMEERLDMLPVSRQVGFFSDAYTIEWAYAKSVMVRCQMAQVLAQKIDQGQYSRDEALDIAAATCYESPREVLGVEPMRQV